MKVLFVIPTLTSGGAERVTTNLANTLVENGHTVRIITFEPITPFYPLDERVQLGCAGVQINRKNRLMSLVQIGTSLIRYGVYTRKEIKAFGPDAVISFLPQADIAVWLAGRNGSFRHICSERNDPTRRGKPMQNLLKRIYEGCDLLVCQAQRVMEFYHRVPNKVVIVNPMDASRLPAAGAESKPPRIVAVNSLLPQKNCPMLLESFARALPQLPQGTTLTVYGEGPLRAGLEQILAEKQLQGKAFLPGADRNVLHTIQDAALFVMASDYEGFPNALAEALALGLPVISTDFATGVARDLIGENRGILVPVGDAQAMSQAMVKLMTDDALRGSIRNDGSEIRAMLDAKAVLQKWLTEIEKIAQ